MYDVFYTFVVASLAFLFLERFSIFRFDMVGTFFHQFQNLHDIASVYVPFATTCFPISNHDFHSEALAYHEKIFFLSEH